MTEKQIDDLIKDYTRWGYDTFVEVINQLRNQRDDARREVCVYEAIEHNRGKMVQTDDIAEERGWQYLYDKDVIPSTQGCNSDDVCPFCTKMTNSFAANPSDWAVTLPIDGNGRTNKCHVGCVMQKINAANSVALARLDALKTVQDIGQEIDPAHDNLALTPQPISTAPKDETPILVWDREWNAWVAARWLDGSWYGDHECSWKGNCLDKGNPQWWLPMPPEPTKMLNGIVVNKGKAVPPKYELDDE
jgi:hypothetical protein